MVLLFNFWKETGCRKKRSYAGKKEGGRKEDEKLVEQKNRENSVCRAGLL